CKAYRQRRKFLQSEDKNEFLCGRLSLPQNPIPGHGQPDDALALPLRALPEIKRSAVGLMGVFSDPGLLLYAGQTRAFRFFSDRLPAILPRLRNAIDVSISSLTRQHRRNARQPRSPRYNHAGGSHLDQAANSMDQACRWPAAF